MVTSKMAPQAKVSYQQHRIYTSSSNYGFRLVDSDHTMDTLSSQGRNSIYKMKIDAMFDDSRSVISQRIDDGGSGRYRRRAFSNNSGGSMRSERSNGSRRGQRGNRVSNSVQAQIERMFTDIENEEVSCSFSVKCLGSLPLKDKVTSLTGLQEPLRQLYLSGAGHGTQNAGVLEICPSGLRVKLSNGRSPIITPFSNIAVWSAVKFVVSAEEGGAAFLPLITDPENIDKSSLFKPLSAADKRRLSSGLHSPLFAVVMRSQNSARQLECHGYVCQSPEDAIVIAATLYQSLMAHMSSSQNPSRKKPKTRNGIGCVSVASSQATTNLVQSSKPPQSVVRSESQRSSSVRSGANRRRRRPTNSSAEQGGRDIIRDALLEVSSSEELQRKKSVKERRAPPIPSNPPPVLKKSNFNAFTTSMSYLEEQSKLKGRQESPPKSTSSLSGGKPHISEPILQTFPESGGDILTKVAIPRSGSFLNTGGLTRYKSKSRRQFGKGSLTNYGGGGSPLGFSELFQEFRLQENLHSLDEILNAIINADGMSYNNLKPIYKEFLLKLAVTLTKDELYQRSKSIMKRQKKKKLKRKQTIKRRSFVSIIGLNKVLRLGHFRAQKPAKTSTKAVQSIAKTKIKNKKAIQCRTTAATSGSELSVAGRTENTVAAQHRNSSSGYVSCSECSYDSDACTCVSADRCYCSLGGEGHTVLDTKLGHGKCVVKRSDSLPSCNSEDKCYCSLGGSDDSHSTTSCDSEGCVSDDKCYCIIQKKPSSGSEKTKTTKGTSNKLSLDYELFNSAGNGKQMKPNEAMSVKKTVEMAAVFADIKLSQTTDIKNLVDAEAKVSKRKMDKVERIDKISKDSGCSVRSTGSEIMKKLEKENQKNKSDDHYQVIPPQSVSHCLEDTLGYLP